MGAAGQAAAPLADVAAPPSVGALANNASLEIAPRQLAGMPTLPEELLPGTEVYVPFLPKARWRETVQACQQLQRFGMTPVPHLTARSVASAGELDDRLAALAASNVDRLLLIAGDQAKPAGPYADTLAVLDSGKLVAHGLRRFGVAAHPEGCSFATAADLDAALTRKMEYATSEGVAMWVVTQFVFAPEPALAFLHRMQHARCGVRVRIGLPGPAKLRTLITFATRCGAGASVRTLTRRPGVVRLLGRWSPGPLLSALGQHHAATPGSPLAGIHVFAFGGIGSTARWLDSERHEGNMERPSTISLATARKPHPSTDGEIVASVALQPVVPLLTRRYGLTADQLIPYGHYKAKLAGPALDVIGQRERGKLVLVTAISPTPAGEGKTTTSIGLADGLNRQGVRAAVCLREPSLGPCFGVKGGAAGGGWAQIAPMADVNLHFNGDLHAITAANNLLAAMVDNHLYWGNALDIDANAVTWRRAIDLNDRALRAVDLNVGRGIRRTGGFDITAASEIMAVFCLAEDRSDLKRRLAEIIVARCRSGKPITVRQLDAQGALAALLTDAMLPNLVQTLEGNPAFVHGGPFANIAHGCNSVLATRAALGLNEVVVTEAGFGADLGAEKFLDIKCRQSGLRPDAAVLVCTVRALKMHGGVAKSDLARPNVEAVRAGGANLCRHIANLQQFGLTPIVAVNRFNDDADAEIAAIEDIARHSGSVAVAANHWAEGGQGAEALAAAVQAQLGEQPNVELLYPDALPLADKLRTVATRIYGAEDISLTDEAQQQLDEFEQLGYGQLPVCIAKTQYSFSADPKAMGAPSGHVLPVREARLCAGAGFVVAISGAIMTMPGLPRRPAAADIGVDDAGQVFGLC